MEVFEEALHEEVGLRRPEPKTILLALDQSNQDQMAVDLAAEMARRHGASIVVTGGFLDDMEEDARTYLSEVSEGLKEQGGDARTLWAPGKESYHKILQALKESAPDLLILPAPYFRDIETLGEDSVGTNLEVILARASVPILVVRDPQFDVGEVLGHIHLAIFDHTEVSRVSAEWSLLLAEGGRMDVLALVEEEFVELTEEALGPVGISEDELVRRFKRGLVPLVSTVLRRCDEFDIPCNVDYLAGDLVDTIAKRWGRRRGMIVLRGYEAHDRPGEKVARDVILFSRVPVLVAKGG